jgi:predicted branched-subunit amino acid permease
MAAQGDGRFDRIFLFGSTAVQYVTWQAGTLVGALAGNVLGDADKLGLDAVYPAFFLAILMVELRRPGAPVAALAGGAIAIVLIPVAPAGIPVLAASIAALSGLRSRLR